jgi:hypothetical protein
MPFVFKRLVLSLSIAAAFAADKDSTPFRPAAADSYEHHQTNSRVTIGVDPYITAEKQKTAFGKLDLYGRGVLPVLVVIQNASDKGHPSGPHEGGICWPQPQPRRCHAGQGCPLSERAEPPGYRARPHRRSEGGQEPKKSAGCLGSGRTRICREDFAAGRIGQRVLLLSGWVAGRGPRFT